MGELSHRLLQLLQFEFGIYFLLVVLPSYYLLLTEATSRPYLPPTSPQALQAWLGLRESARRPWAKAWRGRWAESRATQGDWSSDWSSEMQ